MVECGSVSTSTEPSYGPHPGPWAGVCLSGAALHSNFPLDYGLYFPPHPRVPAQGLGPPKITGLYLRVRQRRHTVPQPFPHPLSLWFSPTFSK